MLRKLSWRIIRAQPMRAILLASAIATTLRGLVANNFVSHGSLLARLEFNTEVAPLTSRRRKYPLLSSGIPTIYRKIVNGEAP